MAAITNHAPAYFIGHFWWTYAVTSTRPLKTYWKIDHNRAPREDIGRADKAVAAGKITQAQLNKLKRNQASHENTIEQLPFFLGSVILATVANVPNEKINRAMLIYTLARIAYHILYVNTAGGPLVIGRTFMWYVGAITNCWLVWSCRGSPVFG